MGTTAFQAITTRQAFTAAVAVAKYDAVELDANGKLALATGALPFMGMVEYGANAADEMATVVRGIFPGVATEDVTTGDYLVIDGAHAGKFKVAGTSAKVVGIAQSDATAGDTLAVLILETPFTTT